MDVTSLCRSCMKEVASWEKDNFDREAIDMFCYCTNIMITDGDKLPKQFCYDCFIKIESSYIFIKEAQRVHITLKNIVSRVQTSIIVEAEHLRNKIVEENVQNITATNFIETENVLIENVNITDDKSSIKQLILSIHNVENSKTSQDEISEHSLHQKSYVCTLCRNSFESDASLSLHINAEHLDKSTNIEQPDKIDNTKLSITDDSKKRKFMCSACGKGFRFGAWLKRHLEREHAGQKFICVHCSKTFQRENALKSHLKCHSDERQHACNVCDVRFKRQKELNAHSRKHSDVRPYPCLQCGRRFKTKSTMQSHTELHEQKKSYLCSICGWSFQQAGNLAVHMRRHTGAKPHRCAECGFRSSSASSLRRHQLRHRGTPSHVCKYCRRAFYDSGGLIRHIRTHTGEQPYKCPHCSRAFTDSWKRKCHLMHQHKLAFEDIPRLPRDPLRDNCEQTH